MNNSFVLAAWIPSAVHAAFDPAQWAVAAGWGLGRILMLMVKVEFWHLSGWN